MSPHDETVTVIFFFTVQRCEPYPQTEGFGTSASFILLQRTPFPQKYEQINLKSKSSPVVEVVLSTDGFSLTVFSETLLLLSL